MIDPDNPPIDQFPKGKDELRDALRRAWSRVNVTRDGKPSPGETLQDLVPWRFPKTKPLPEKIQLWLMIYDEAVSWVCTLYVSCESELLHSLPEKPANWDLVSAILRLSARAVSDLYAVRNLVSFGLEPAARVILRSTMEHLDTISLLLLEPNHVHGFLATSEPEAGNLFWHRNLSKDKLRKSVKNYFGTIDADFATEVLSRRSQRNRLYGAAVHPSKYSCDMALFTPEAMRNRAENHIGIGYPTTISCNTLHDAVWAIFELSLVLHQRALASNAAITNLFEKSYDTFLVGLLREGPSVFLSILVTVNHPSLEKVYHDLVSYPGNVSDQ